MSLRVSVVRGCIPRENVVRGYVGAEMSCAEASCHEQIVTESVSVIGGGAIRPE